MSMQSVEPPPRDTQSHQAGQLEAALSRSAESEGTSGGPAITYTETIDEGNTVSISPEVEDILGFTPEEWMGNNIWTQILHPEDRHRVVTSCHAANRARQSFRDEYRMITKDGRIVWIRDEAAIVWSSNGEPMCWQGRMLDITSEKEAE